jgi:hypothetical protein
MTSQTVNTHKGGDDMQSWNFRKSFLCFITIMVMVLALAFTGCSDDDDDENEVGAEDLEGRTFDFPGAVIFDPNLAGLNASLAFGAADGNEMPFTLTFNDPAGTELSGIATVGSPLNCPAAAAEQEGELATFPVTISGGTADVEVAAGDDLCDGIDVTFSDSTLLFTKGDVTVEFPLTGGSGSFAD